MAKTGRRTKLTAELAKAICETIRAGAFPTIAAETCGLGQTTFFRWLRIGRSKRAPAPFRQFWQQVEQARATASHNAETRVFRSSPLEWLRKGPGRARWGDRTELTIGGMPDRPLRIEQQRIAPIENLAGAYLFLGQVGVLPAFTGEQILALEHFGADPDGAKEQGEGGVPEGVCTQTPEWMRALRPTPSQGRRKGGGKSKQKKTKDGEKKDDKGGGRPATTPRVPPA